MSRKRAAWAALAVITAVGTAASPAQGAPSAPAAVAAVAVNGKIAYVAYGPSTIPFGPPTQADIWVMDPDGSNAVNLTHSSDVDDLEPAWSPDGTKLAFISDSLLRTLSVMNADGTGRVTIMDGAYSPSWGPDGTKIAVQHSSGVSAPLVIVDVATLAETLVSENVALDPTWSPDGSKIAFVGVRQETYPDPITGDPITGAQHEIVVVNPDGTGEQVISTGEPGSVRATQLEDDRTPAWSPDSNMVVFMSQDQIGGCCGRWQLWAANVDGSGLTNLTADGSVDDMYPSWSPDGTSIVFTRFSGVLMDLFTMPAPTSLPLAAPAARERALGPTGAAVPLTSDGNAQDPDWAPAVAAPLTYRLGVTVKHTAGGRGRVVSDPAGIRCGTDCSQRYDAGTVVTLRAVPRPESHFVRWSGGCSGKARTCTVTMSRARSVTAVFHR